MKNQNQNQPPAPLCVDGTDGSGNQAGDGANAPFWVFDPNSQRHIAGPFQTHKEASFVVRACNSHAALVDALGGLLDQVTGPAQVYGDGRGNDGKKTGLSHEEFNALRDEWITRARALLAQLEGQV